ncbi:MAG TPA: hypothetical protein VMF56_08080 [Acidobacteriaceae bacterium]|nr:hypothetical protein [Acidobacteriaceae bacterium]
MLDSPSKKNQKLCRPHGQPFSTLSYDDFELLELPALDLPEPESLDDVVVEEDEEESDVEAAGLLPLESDFPSDAAAEMSALPSDLPAESDLAGLLPDLA